MHACMHTYIHAYIHLARTHTHTSLHTYRNASCTSKPTPPVPHRAHPPTQEYMDAIRAAVSWLGHTPVRETYTSDYFDELLHCAHRLIDKGLAYVCHQTAAQVTAL